MPTPRDVGRQMVMGEHLVDRWRIPEYLTEENREKIGFFMHYKVFGWPYSGGWAEQPANLADIVFALEGELNKKK